MSRASKVIITTVIVVVIIALGWIIIRTMNTNDSADTPSEPNQTELSNDEATQDVALSISYNGTKFSPANETVRVGDRIEVVNNSQNVMEFASDQHPTHNDNSELNVGDIQPGERATFTVLTPGTWGFHDHYNATAGGELIVE